MLGAHYHEECMEKLLDSMDKFLKNHSIYEFLALVAVAIERNYEHKGEH